MRGLPGAGKTTVARSLAAELGAVRWAPASNHHPDPGVSPGTSAPKYPGPRSKQGEGGNTNPPHFCSNATARSICSLGIRMASHRSR